MLGILISRVAGRPVGEHLAGDVFGPVAMTGTALWVAAGKPAARRVAGTVPGDWRRPGPPAAVSAPGRRRSTSATASSFTAARGFHRFARMLAGAGRVSGQPVISPDHLRRLASDQVPAACKPAGGFFPGFWDGTGWGFGVAVKTAGPQRGRIGWSGGRGTGFFADQDGTAGILLTQVEMGKDMWPLAGQFQSLHEPS